MAENLAPEFIINDTIVESTFSVADLTIPLAILVIVLFIGGLLYYLIRNVMPMTPYIYANARIQARSSSMIDSREIQELASKKSLAEAVSALHSSEYGRRLEQVKDLNIASVHRAIEGHYHDAIAEMLDLSPDEMKKVIVALSRTEEAKVFKAVYRAKYMGTTQSEVQPFGKLEGSLLMQLQSAKSVADFKVILAGSFWEPVVKKEYRSLQEFEVEAEQHLYNSLLMTIENSKLVDKLAIAQIIVTRVDSQNILAVLKAMIRDEAPMLININTDLHKRLKRLSQAKDIDEVLRALKHTPYLEAMTKAAEQFKKDGNYYHFEIELGRFQQKTLVDEEIAHTLGPYPLVAYLIKKEYEMRNLFLATKTIQTKRKLEEEMII
ncbi:V-type ATPase subunit [Candidatus Woesearchaeota archaeon]|nr:V-type ATPase subunit [Candidatus Woesearchaeota archaeon]